jgi:hypothetical protein
MSEIQIHTVETRRFHSKDFRLSIELEFHKNPPWAAALPERAAAPADLELDGTAFARLASRVALTGSALPPLSFSSSAWGEPWPVPFSEQDLFNLSLVIAAFGRLPTDRHEESLRLNLRAKILRYLDLDDGFDVVLKTGRRFAEQEERINTLAAQLGAYSIALSRSPTLSFESFIGLVSKYKRVFTFSRAADALLGTAALSSAYQIANVNPVLAIELAAAGSVAYVILKSGPIIEGHLRRFWHE